MGIGRFQERFPDVSFWSSECVMWWTIPEQVRTWTPA